MKNRFNSNDDFPLGKTLKIYNVVISIISAFYDNNKYYPQVVLG